MQYVDDMYAYALSFGFDKQTSMDAIHDVFCKICEQENRLSEVDNIKFYLLKSLKNRLLDISKTRKVYFELSDNIILEKLPFSIRITIEDEFIKAEEKEKIKQKIESILNLLTDREREIIYLRYMQEYDYDKIAELMNITPPSCRKLLHKAISKLRESGQLYVLLVLAIIK